MNVHELQLVGVDTEQQLHAARTIDFIDRFDRAMDMDGPVGDPRQLTLAAVDAINAADVILIPLKGEEKSDLAELRRQICADVLTSGTPRLSKRDMTLRFATWQVWEFCHRSYARAARVLSRWRGRPD